jgi:UDP-N-acetylglucosamine 2-epimerase (non-hydrolysing)
MPEEINRILTDSISDLLFVTEQAGIDNLKHEGVPDEKVFMVGNCMIDSLVHYRQKAGQIDVITELGVEKGEFVLMTMHRPANVDTPEGLASILQIIENTTRYKKVLFPIHPRTRNNIEKFGLKAKLDGIEGLILTEPQGYLEFLNLMENSSLVVTDSGGIQEETTYLQVPCLTFRDSTERPVTVELGTNQLLADLNPQTVHGKVVEILEGRTKEGIIPPLWDGNAAERIADILVKRATH